MTKSYYSTHKTTTQAWSVRNTPCLQFHFIISTDLFLFRDDVRDIQKHDVIEPLPVYLNEETYSVCKRVFPYLITENNQKPGQEPGVQRRVAHLDWRVIRHPFVKFEPVPGVDVSFTPIPLLHGGDYICWGYLIHVGTHNTSGNHCIIAYLSDVHEVPQQSMAFLKAAGHIDILVIDGLSWSKRHPTHFSLEQAEELARTLRPRLTRCVGMGCRIGDHFVANEELAKRNAEFGLDFLLAHDGLKISIDPSSFS